MPLEKNPARKLRTQPLAFRFSEDAERKLKVVAAALNKKQVHVLEALLSDAYKNVKKRYPEEIRAAEAKIKKERSQ